MDLGFISWQNVKLSHPERVSELWLVRGVKWMSERPGSVVARG